MWWCSLDSKHARWVRVSLLFQLFVQSFSTPGGFPFVPRVRIRQALSKRRSNAVKGGSEYIGRFFGTFYCFRASCRVLLFFFILYPICPPGREREDCRAFERCYCLFALCISFFNRVFSVREIANSLSKHCCNRWASLTCNQLCIKWNSNVI